ncbi:E3 ubiquitin-protein ligase [Vigna unguiculata]|uniref:RING-type E3 ubiquitin transferase n=1 Tax=Vigna unguiculata TaxID=3917 RepID=A0A4D6M2C6_VIGUN|nr:E3 ubiquitin-protein ligase [Vigna unguiculata]
MSGLDECTIMRGSNIDSHYIVNAYDYGMTEYERVGHQRLPLSSTSSVAPREFSYPIYPTSFYYYSIHFDYPLRLVPSYTLPTNPSTSSLMHAPFAHHSQPLRPNMDIQDMSYEASIYELNELAERIGKVDTGLPDEIIARQMKTEIYQLPNHSEEQEVDLCIICQDEYKNKDQIGILQCGHRYHSDCITTWLHEKNVCPICKSQALTIQ